MQLNASNIHKNDKMKKMCIVLVFIAVVFIFVHNQMGTKKYQTQEQYKNAGGAILFEIPVNATDCRFAIFRSLISKCYFYSYELDKDSLEKYAAELVERFHVNESDPDIKYGYGKWYGKKVKDCFDPSYTLNDFPINLPFAAVIDDSIEDYEVVLYWPHGTGTHSFGVVVNRNIYRVVVYEFYTL